MKKLFLLLIPLLVLLFTLKANAQTNVSSFTYLNALIMQNSAQNIRLNGTIISGANYGVVGSGLKTIDGNNAVLNGSKFAGIRSNLAAANTIFTSGITFQNFAAYAGGALLSAGNISFNNATVKFTSNTAQYGGGLGSYEYATTTQFINSAITFTSNTAVQGGALYSGVNNQIMNFNNNTINFDRNIVRSTATNGDPSAGGAIFTWNATLNFSSNIVNFTNNAAQSIGLQSYGGALFLHNTIANFSSSTVLFFNNNAVSENAAYGGAIFVEYSTLNFVNSDINFTSNSVTQNIGDSTGGAIYVKFGLVNFSSAVVKFEGNSSISATTDGGAALSVHNYSVYSSNNSRIDFKNNITQNTTGNLYLGTMNLVASSASFSKDVVNFDGNKATSVNSNAVNGSGFSVLGSQISFNDSVINFINNKSESTLGQLLGGGFYNTQAIFNAKNSTMTFISNELIQTDPSNINTAEGAGLYFYTSSAMFENTSLNFTSNVINAVDVGMGGGMFLLDSTVTFKGVNADFTGNTVNSLSNSAFGGGISTFFNPATIGVTFFNVENSTINFTANKVVSASNHGIGGGAFFVLSVVNFNNVEMNFTNNITSGAVAAAGGLYAHQSNINFVDGRTVFEGNKVFSTSGTGNGYARAGAAEAYLSTVAFINNYTEFSENIAHSGGALFGNIGSTIIFSSGTTNFINNKAYGNDGGAIFSVDANINFSSGIVKFEGNSVINNTTFIGAGIYGEGAAIADMNSIYTFNNNTIDFKNNFSQGFDYAHGAVLAHKSIMNFTGNIINFEGNIAKDSAAGGLGSASGGALHAYASYLSFSSNIINFTSNTAQGSNASSGGAIYIGDSSTMSFTGTTVTFQGNSAQQGAAVSVVRNSSMIFTGGAVEFLWNNTTNGNGVVYWDTSSYVGLENAKITKAIGNQANNGGFLYLVNQGTWSFANIDMSSNTARSGYGGALYLNSTTVVFSGTNTISYNTATNNGGAIYLADSSTMSFAGTATFDGNKASVNGGALYITGNTSQIIFADGSTITFTNNNAQQGGAVYATAGANVVFTTGAHYAVSNNTATYGGFIAVNNATATFKSGVDFSLSNSSATYGGFLYATNNAIANFENVYASSNSAALGGFIAAESGAIINITGSTISANVATSNGGAIYLADSSTMSFAGTATFDGNKASVNGGALYITGNTSQIIFADGSTITFTNNNAQQGGAVYAAAGANVVFTTGAHYVISNNTATYGGFIAVNNATATFKSGVDFSLSNSSATYGGFLYATNNAIANFENVYASSNSAQLGGFIAAESGAIINIGSATITGNVATSSGGAIYLQTSTATFDSTGGLILLTGNTANGTPNDIYAEGSFINFNAENNQIRIEDGIYVGNAQNTISKTGLGELYISGNNYMQGNFNVTAGSVTIERATWTFENGNWNVTTSSGVRITSSVVTIANSVTSAFEQNQGWATSIIDSTITFNAAVRFSTNSGAISALNSQITFNDNIVVEGHSNAMVVTGSSMSFNGALKMFVGSGVSSTGVGGGAISSSNSVVLFKNGTSNFINNNNNASYASGGAIYAEGSTISFTNERVTFTSNAVTTGGGGAIYSDGSLVEFITSTAIFAGNRGDYGTGGIYAYNNAIVRFINSNAEFTENKITSGSGGAMNVRGLLYVDGGKISFTSNTANNYGGAIYTLNDSSNVFVNTEVKFTSNNATEGGAIYANTRSTITFTAAPVIFDNNIAAVNGGAIYSNLANITFNNGSATFTNNKALTGSGGAIYAVDDLVFDGANVDFTGNEALSGNGGAIFADDTILTIKNAVMTFMNNKSLLGGAVYASNNSNITLSGRGNFTGNEAATNGAAVYVTGGSTVTIEAANGDIIFSGNKAAGTPNDIYADNNSRLNLITSGTNTISIAGGILSNTAGTAIEVNKTGTGTLFMGGDNEVWGDFTATAGKVVLLESATFKANNIIFNGAELDMTDADLYDNLHVNVATATTMFASDTSLLMDIFENGNNDQIFASSAQIGGNLQIKAHFGVYNNQEYHLIMSSENAINGTFANATFVYVGTGAFSYQVKYNDITDWTGVVRIIVNGINKGDFQNLPKLTFNQSEVAKTWDELSIILPTNDLKEIMEATANLSDQEEQKSVLGIASGYFHSNVIKSAALDNDNNEIYDRIKNHSTKEHTNSAIWAQVTGAQTKLGGDENSLGEYKDNRYGVMAGFDIYFGSMSSINKTMLGIYVNYKDQSMNQEASKATLNKIGGGLYGGYIEEKYEIKAMINGSKDSYETTRNIAISQYLPVPPYADRNAKANYEGFTLGADVEGALKYKIGNNTNFRPYAGAELKNVSYDGFTETGAEGLNLKVEAGNYLRTTARVGAGVNYDDKTWAGYVNLEGKYLLTGKKYEIESVFEGTEVKFLSRGYEENGLILGATLGGSVRITEGLKFFINANAHTAEKFTNLYANAGLRYNFCGITHKEKEEPVPAPVVVVEQAKPEIIEQPKPAVEAGKKQIQPYRSRAVNFDTNKYLLKSNHIMSIKEHAEYIKQHEYKKITIEGHTDSTGNEKVNQPLSERRAQSVYNELANNGIPKEKMEIVGHSSKNPVDTNKTKKGRANNRRTEIVVE
ncbi:OmpA family protein [Endomicrobium proavitum]|uniref:Autotransporter domain-containing protein n=1 Tax=Endomicrobium proavitum TaxID=1408281 RepID=A0A0G3WGT1_9BACT|nr:OmpA family protein [Endomicrobium proavitum]AKL97528.1 exported protein of unknown function [Endomicrobium proavitum]